MNGILSDQDIKRELKDGDLVVEPIKDPLIQIQPCTVDMRLGNEFQIFDKKNLTHIDPLDQRDIDKYTETVNVDEYFVIHPGRFTLAHTVEWVEIPNNMIGKVEGRSSLGRLAIVIHATAGLCDPGYKGHITLEISNLGSAPVVLRTGMRISQLMLMYLNSPAEVPYGEERGSKYQNQEGVASSRIGSDPEFADSNGGEE